MEDNNIVPDLDYENMPESTNIEDRRNETYSPLGSIKEQIFEFLNTDMSQLLPWKKYGEYDKDIDDFVKRIRAEEKIDPVLNELKKLDDWFKEIEHQEQGGSGPSVPPEIMKLYQDMKNSEPRQGGVVLR